MDAIYDPVRGSRGRTYVRRAALLDAPDLFDADFFGLNAREARALDPQHRLVLEVTWQALEHAKNRSAIALEQSRRSIFSASAARPT